MVKYSVIYSADYHPYKMFGSIILKKYVMRAVARPFFGSLWIVVAMMMIIQLTSMISLRDAIEITDLMFLVYAIPCTVFRVMPIVAIFATAILSTYFHENRVLITIAGLGGKKESLRRIIMFFAICITTIHLIISIFVLPGAHQGMVKVDNEMRNRYVASIIKHGAIRNYGDEIMIDAPKDGSMKDIVMMLRHDGGEQIIIAESAYITVEDYRFMSFNFNNATVRGDGYELAKVSSYQFRIDSGSILSHLGIKMKKLSYRDESISFLLNKLQNSVSAGEKKEAVVALLHRGLWPFYNLTIIFIMSNILIGEYVDRFTYRKVLAFLASFMMIFLHYALQDQCSMNGNVVFFMMMPFAPFILYWCVLFVRSLSRRCKNVNA